RDVQQPASKKSVWEAMKERRLQQARTDEDKKDLNARADLRVGALGSGSDYTPFLQHLGIASMNTGFGGDGGGGVYHSIYDSFARITKCGVLNFEHVIEISHIKGSIV